ncbi:hypothetical protein AOA60_26905, partial [Pseudomonas sp. 2822-17]
PLILISILIAAGLGFCSFHGFSLGLNLYLEFTKFIHLTYVSLGLHHLLRFTIMEKYNFPCRTIWTAPHTTGNLHEGRFSENSILSS